MTSIFPPHGPRDETRFASNSTEDVKYMWFSLEFCGQILERRPAHLEALELAANHLTELGYYNDGLVLDRRLATLRPNDPGVLYNLSCSLALTGAVDEALAELEKAVRKGYRDYRHIVSDRDLASLRGDPRFNNILLLASSEKRH